MSNNPQRLKPVSYAAVYEVLAFLRNNSVSGRCAMSILEIAERLGVSTATVQRALRKLQADGLIKIESSRTPTEPNTIVLIDGDTMDLAVMATQASRDLEAIKEMVRQLEGYMVAMTRQVVDMEEAAKRYYRLMHHVTSVTKLTDDLYQLIVPSNSVPWLKELTDS